MRQWLLCLIVCAVFSPAALAVTGDLNLTLSPVGIISLVVFVLAYVLVMAEEKLHLRKSKPVLVAAGIIWALVAWRYMQDDLSGVTADAFRHTLLEFAELMLFLLVAMTYINALEERRLFDSLRAWLIRKGFSYRSLFWISGVLAFVISSFANNIPAHVPTIKNIVFLVFFKILPNLG